MRRKMFGPGALFIAIFPLGALIAFYFAMKSSIRRFGLVQKGILARAVCRTIEATNTTVNSNPVQQMVFCFKDNSGNDFEVSYNTQNPGETGDEADVLYLESNPEKATLLDALPSRIRFNKQGDVDPVPLKPVLWTALIPFLTIFGHGATLLSLLL